MMKILIAGAVAFLLHSIPVTAWAQVAAPQPSIPNPLRTTQPTPQAQPKTTQPTGAAAAPSPATADSAKPKRERSAKQKQGDDDMRACGASWKADKDALKAKGLTWRTYLKECRGQKKTARGA